MFPVPNSGTGERIVFLRGGPFGLTERESTGTDVGAPSGRPVDLDRRGIPQRLVKAVLVIEVEIAIHSMADLGHRLVSLQVDVFVCI